MITLKRIRIVLVGAAVTLLAASSWGCMIIPLHTGTPVPEQRVKEKIQPGKTTKQELFALLGAPMAIAVQGEMTAVLLPSAVVSRPPHSREYYEIQADPFFELFSTRHTLTVYHQVYCYYNAWNITMTFFGVVAYYETGNTTIDRLWVLVNEKTGIVEDYVFRKHH
jgi:hypothetical protein